MNECMNELTTEWKWKCDGVRGIRNEERHQNRLFCDRPTDWPTDQPTNQPTDRDDLSLSLSLSLSYQIWMAWFIKQGLAELNPSEKRRFGLTYVFDAHTNACMHTNTHRHAHKDTYNKPDRAMMRPDCVLTWSEIRDDCPWHMGRPMDEQIDKLRENLT